MTISEKYVLIDLGNTVSIYKENKCWCMGGDKEEGVEVIGQQSRETLNLFFFPTDQQLFTPHHKRYHIQMQANTQTHKHTIKQTNMLSVFPRQLFKLAWSHYMQTNTHKRFLGIWEPSVIWLSSEFKIKFLSIVPNQINYIFVLVFEVIFLLWSKLDED